MMNRRLRRLTQIRRKDEGGFHQPGDLGLEMEADEVQRLNFLGGGDTPAWPPPR